MKILNVDVAVIGAGSAGLTAYRAARALGARTVLIEGGPYGTTCARVGCMPSKLLIAAAEAAHAVQLAPQFGVLTQANASAEIDGAAVMARVRSERDRFVGFVLQRVEHMPEQDRLRGHARFTGPASLVVDDHTSVQAKGIVIATGSRPRIPEQLAALGKRVITSDDVFDWTTLPKSVAVVGTGVIGLELGQALHRLGVRVTLFGRGDSLAQIADPTVRDRARQVFAAELDLRQNTSITGAALEAALEAEPARLRWRDASGAELSGSFEYVLAASGRIPNLEGLDLKAAGIALDEHGVPGFDSGTMQCAMDSRDSAIFIAGDANTERAVLHEAVDQGRIAGANAARHAKGARIEPGARAVPLAIGFTDPQVASVGQTWRSLPARRFAIGEVSFDDQGRSRVMLQNCGLLRIYAEFGSERLLGAEMVGPRAEHLAHLLAWACQQGMTIPAMLGMPFYHPVVEEGLKTALRDAREKLERGLPEIEHCADCTPGT